MVTVPYASNNLDYEFPRAFLSFQHRNFICTMSESDLDTLEYSSLDDCSDFKGLQQHTFGRVGILALHRQRTKVVTESAILQLADSDSSPPVTIIKIAVLCSYNCDQQDW